MTTSFCRYTTAPPVCRHHHGRCFSGGVVCESTLINIVPASPDVTCLRAIQAICTLSTILHEGIGIRLSKPTYLLYVLRNLTSDQAEITCAWPERAGLSCASRCASLQSKTWNNSFTRACEYRAFLLCRNRIASSAKRRRDVLAVFMRQPYSRKPASKSTIVLVRMDLVNVFADAHETRCARLRPLFAFTRCLPLSAVNQICARDRRRPWKTFFSRLGSGDEISAHSDSDDFRLRSEAHSESLTPLSV